jgi:hypothetical protein
MDKYCEVEKKNVYGRDLFYPRNDAAKLFAAIADSKTLQVADLKKIELLGFEILTFTEAIKLF